MRLSIPRKGSAYLDAGAYAVRAGFGVMLYGTTPVAIAQPGATLHCTGVECVRAIHELRLERCDAPVEVRDLYERMDFLTRTVEERLADTKALAADWKLRDTDLATVIGVERKTIWRTKLKRSRG